LAALPCVSNAEPALHGITPLQQAVVTQDDAVTCLKDALANGDPATGPSTLLLKAAPGCRVRPHSHTAEEQPIVIRGASRRE
jgi:hypothetical protein